MPECTLVTFDFGGTKMRGAVVAIQKSNWSVLHQLYRPTSNYLFVPNISAMKRLDDLLDFLVDYAGSARIRFGAQALIAALPGPIQGAGTVLALATILGPDSQSLCPIDLSAKIASRLPDIPIKLINDVTAAGYRFVSEGGDFAIFTLGSGIGLKIFLNGKPCVGPHGLGGELAHMVFDRSLDAPLCDCGERGHLGALASGRAWRRIITSTLESGHMPNLLNFTEPLARAVAMLHFSLGLERFIFAGGLVEELGEPLRSSIVQNLPVQGWNVGQDWNAMVQLAPADYAHALIGGAIAFANNDL